MFEIAEVRNIKDPMKAGRVQVRIYGKNDDEQDIKDEDLPWAVSVTPITSASTGKVGIVPVGLLVGSRVLIAYASNDPEKQYPFVVGSFHRAGSPKRG
jgi:hypothetical protein